eukprot:8223221-Alexandrium_andersonii.AAC.1
MSPTAAPAAASPLLPHCRSLAPTVVPAADECPLRLRLHLCCSCRASRSSATTVALAAGGVGCSPASL